MDGLACGRRPHRRRGLEVLTTRYARAAREVGALSVLPTVLNHQAVVRVHHGDLNDASTLLDEADRIAAASSGPRMLVARAWLAACWAAEREFLDVHEELEREATARGDHASLAAAAWIWPGSACRYSPSVPPAS
jgi:hypothetical protein